MSNSDEPQGNAAKPDSEAASATSASEAPRARLTRLKINRFRNVKPGTELRFDEGINVLLGRNGTGKTTLLELVCAVVSGDLRAYEAEALDLEFEMLLGGEHLSVAARTDSGPQEPFSLLTGNDSRRNWSYRIVLARQDGRVQVIEATNHTTAIYEGTNLQATHPEEPLFAPYFFARSLRLLAPAQGDVSVVRAIELQGFIANTCIRLDEGLDTFRAITSGLKLPRIGTLAAHIISGLYDGGIFSHLLALYVPLPLIDYLLSLQEDTLTVTELEVPKNHWPGLNVLAKATGAKSMRVTLRLIERKQSQDGSGGPSISTFGQPAFWITTHGGTTFTHNQLSYGEKRLLAFMYHAACNPEILVVDELVNGLHHGWIQACLDAIRGQAFLTSQNPLLLDYLPFSSAEEVQRRFILCDRDEHGAWIWRNMDEDAAGAFFRAYKVGIQHVSEILETKGLW